MQVANEQMSHPSSARAGRGLPAALRPALLLFLVAAMLGACAKSKPAPEVPAAAEPETPPGAAQTGGALVLRVAYTEGLVERLGASSVTAVLGPGDLLFPGDTLRTGKDGRCDLEIEELGSIRLLPDSLLRLDAAGILGSGPRFTAELQSGRILAKARKLAGGEAFMLRTKHAICGVRGTAFALELREGGSLIAVEEGRVAVLPQGPVLSRIEGAAATSEAARGLLRALVALAPLVESGEEYALDSAAASKAEAAYESFAAALPAAAADAPTLPPEALIPAESLVAEPAAGTPAATGAAALPALRETLQAAFPKPRPAGPETKALREELRSFSGAAGAPGAAPAVPSPAAAPGAQAASPQAPKSLARNPALLGSSSLFAGRAVANLQSAAGELLIGADGAGAFVALDAAGGRRWSVELAGASAALRSKEKVILAGESAFLVLDAASGRELARGPGLAAGAHLSAFPEGCLAATAVGVLRYPEGGAESVKEYPLAGGALAAANYEGKILAAPGQGGLVLLDAETGAVLAATSSPASPHLRLYAASVALAGPAPAAVTAVATGGPDPRGGRLVVFDLPGLARRWEAPLAFRPGAEPEFNKEGVYVWGRASLAAFSPEGRPLGQIEGVVAPPLLSRGVLYYGTKDGDFVAASPLDLKPLASLRLPSPLAGRPMAVGEELRLPLRDGSVLRLDPRLLRP